MDVRLRTLGLVLLATVLVAPPTSAQAQPTDEELPSRRPRHLEADEVYKYRFTPPAGRWSVFGGQGSWGCPWDDDGLFDDQGGCIRANVALFGEWGTPPLAVSRNSRHVEFVAIDGNHQPVDEYAAKLTALGEGTVHVEADYSSRVLTDETHTYDERHIIRVFDTYLRGGTSYRFTASVNEVGARLSIYLLDSDPADSTTWHQAAGEGIRARDGDLVELEYTNEVDPSGRGDWYAVVITQDYSAYSHPIVVSRETLE